MSLSCVQHLFERGLWWYAENKLPCGISVGMEPALLCPGKAKGHKKLYLGNTMPKQEKENTFLYLTVFAAGVG